MKTEVATTARRYHLIFGVIPRHHHTTASLQARAFCCTSHQRRVRRICLWSAVFVFVTSYSVVLPAYAADGAIDSNSPTTPDQSTSGFNSLDWIALCAYGLGLMGIGWYYSRAKNVDEYLLGGRHMKPGIVGISLFSTLMSTLAYLAYPGEMIRHGPLFFSGMVSYPLVYIVVCRFIIPAFMRLRVTTAYEILEDRFGVGVRMFGSAIFLVLRFQWMALMVYATSSAVLVPLLGLPHSFTPIVCVVMCFLTVAYTSMGGLRAVVVTDVVQTIIMLVGIAVSLGYITYSLGGISAWWPTSWAPHWDPPSLSFNPSSRIALGPALISTFVWCVCTAGSDQMAVQRYLATRDLRAARHMFAVSLVCDVFVAALLALLGLALLAYFSTNPLLLEGSATLLSDSDQLMPQFFARVLPGGLGGLIVAGILSAAMNSLSSGINSSCSVVTTDWINRFRSGSTKSSFSSVRQAKVVSWAIGGTVVLLSLFANLVGGSLLEKCYTIVNLLTAPLFVLFFMAMFVPWATAFGAWAAGLVSIAMAVLLAYAHLFDLSFLWITPISLLAGACAGCLASFLPLGSRCPMLETKI